MIGMVGWIVLLICWLSKVMENYSENCCTEMCVLYGDCRKDCIYECKGWWNIEWHKTRFCRMRCDLKSAIV